MVTVCQPSQLLCSGLGRADETALNLGELRLAEMHDRLPPKNPTDTKGVSLQL